MTDCPLRGNLLAIDSWTLEGIGFKLRLPHFLRILVLLQLSILVSSVPPQYMTKPRLSGRAACQGY